MGINEDIYIDSLLWRSNIDMDDHSIDATFEEALADNGIIEPLDDLVDAFDELYNAYIIKNNFEEIGDLNEGQSESSDSWNDSGDLDKYDIYPDTPTLKSTPSSNKNWENSKPILGTGLVDSGFLDSFDLGSESVCDVTAEKEHYPPAVKNPAQVAKGSRRSFLRQLFGFSLIILISELVSLF